MNYLFKDALIMLCCICSFYLSSPYLCLFGDDHVTCYMGADGDAGEHADA